MSASTSSPLPPAVQPHKDEADMLALSALKASLPRQWFGPATSAPARVTKTRIICTIGPKTNNEDSLCQLLEAGMNVARLNFSHGDFKFHGEIIQNVRAASKRTGKLCAIMLDTKGPEIRTGKLKGGKPVALKTGRPFLFYDDETRLGDENGVPTTYKRLAEAVKPGDTILVSDGLLGFTVVKAGGGLVETVVANDGMLGETKGVNLPGVVVDLPAVTEKDIRDIIFGVEQGVDFIAASFIRKGVDVQTIRNLPGLRQAGIRIISKIESQEGLDNFEDILKESDGIMVARGDLGVEIPIERVANAQKMMIARCNVVGKPVITATQMLDSMIVNPRPTRAEATDVANAVFDGTDCVMLSGETAAGHYPVECVKIMSNICLEAENVIDYRSLYQRIRARQTPPITTAESVASSAVKSAWDLGAAVIVALTESGATLRFIGKYRPSQPIVCVTPSPVTARQVCVTRGAIPFIVQSMKDTDHLVMSILQKCKESGLVKSGDVAVLTSGALEGISGSTNIMKVLRVE